MTDIFLSYNREDQARAKLFAEAFEAQGFAVWWDVGLRTGEAYDQVTEKALRDAKAVVVLWSKKSVESRWVRAEATLADRNKTLLPCMIEPCERPIMFELTQTAELSHWQGDADDPAWTAFLGDVKRFIEAGAKTASTPVTAPAPTVSSPAGREGERRQIAVLNCAPAMAPDDDMDPEDWQDAFATFRTRADAIVASFGGRMIDAPGDGVLVFFGMDQAREDDAERAVRAGLALLDIARDGKPDAGAKLSLRAGVDVGPVLLGAGRAAPAGAAIGASAQLLTQAPPDSVLVSAAAATLVGGYFQLETHGARTFRVAAAHSGRTRFDISRARGLSSFVGRTSDFHTLETALAQAATGNGQVIGIVAEAGAGKSRLCFEFTEHCRGKGLQVFEGRAVAHGRNIPFLPILDVFRSFFGIRVDDDAGATRAKIDLRLTELDAKVANAAPLVFEFLGVADPARPAPKLDPDARQRQLLGLMRHLIKLAGDEQPTVMLIEDLHWMDAASASFLDQLVEAREGARSLLLLNFRPEYQADWTKNSWYRQIPLAPLGREAVDELLTDLLGTDPSLVPLAAMIRTRTKGNPFFIEEIVQNLIETGHLVGNRGAFRLVTSVDKLEVPATVKAVLAARIDRLAERDRKLLQTAAVIGKDFSEPVLAAVSDLAPEDFHAALAALRRAEFIQEQSLFPVAEHAFRHPLTQEVAYAGLLKDRRRQTHASVARVIEAHDAAQLDERSALLAHHWEEAGDVLTAAQWHARAAEWAGLTNATEALRHWQRARHLLRSAPQTAETVQFGVAACMGALGLSWRLGTPKAEITDVFEEGLKLAEASGDITTQAALNGIYGCFLGLVEGLSDEYCRYAKEAIRLAEQTDNQGLQIAQRAFFGFGTVLAGRLKEGLASCEWAFEHLPADPELGRAFTGYSPYLGLLDVYGWILTRSGRIAEARAAIAKVEALARESGDFEILTWLGLPNSEMAVACADAVAARGYADIALVSGERSATAQSRMVGVASHGAACRLEKRWEAAVEASGQAVQLALAGANREFEGWVRSELALALLGLGDIDGAEREAEASAAVARSQPSRFDEVRGHLALIRTLLARGGEEALARADISLERAQSLTDAFEINVYLAELHECRARIALARGDAATTQAALARARQSYGAMGASLQLDRLAHEFP